MSIINGCKVEMQANIEKRADITIKLSKNYYSFKKGTFRVAVLMAVEVNNNNQIISITAFCNYEPKFLNDTELYT